jgi:hypothetical protein
VAESTRGDRLVVRDRGSAWIFIANLRTMRPLWTSPALERSQRIAQTILMWLVPGAYLVIRAIVLPQRPGARSDPTSYPNVGTDYRGYANIDHPGNGHH